MIQKNNVTDAVLNSLHTIPGLSGRSDPNAAAESAGNMLANLIPGISRQAQNARAGSQMLDSLAQTFPGLRNFVPSTLTPTATNNRQGNQKTFDTAIDQVHCCFVIIL